MTIGRSRPRCSRPTTCAATLAKNANSTLDSSRLSKTAGSLAPPSPVPPPSYGLGPPPASSLSPPPPIAKKNDAIKPASSRPALQTQQLGREAHRLLASQPGDVRRRPGNSLESTVPASVAIVRIAHESRTYSDHRDNRQGSHSAIAYRN